MDELQPDSAERLQIAALEAFSARGYHGTTTREIAARAGLSPAGIYLHHASKADLLELVVTAAHELLISDLHSAASQGFNTAADRLAALVDAHVRFHARHQAMARVANYELHSLSEAAHGRVLKLRQSIEATMQAALESCCAEASCSTENIRLATFAILTASIGVARWYRQDGALNMDEFVDSYSRIILGMVLVPTSHKDESKRSLDDRRR